MPGPVYTCQLCGRVQAVTPDGRGFPPDIAKRKLVKACKANDCESDPKYTAGLSPELHALLYRRNYND